MKKLVATKIQLQMRNVLLLMTVLPMLFSCSKDSVDDTPNPLESLTEERVPGPNKYVREYKIYLQNNSLGFYDTFLIDRDNGYVDTSTILWVVGRIPQQTDSTTIKDGIEFVDEQHARWINYRSYSKKEGYRIVSLKETNRTTEEGGYEQSIYRSYETTKQELLDAIRGQDYTNETQLPDSVFVFTSMNGTLVSQTGSPIYEQISTVTYDFGYHDDTIPYKDGTIKVFFDTTNVDIVGELGFIIDYDTTDFSYAKTDVGIKFVNVVNSREYTGYLLGNTLTFQGQEYVK